jgi:hypothetical protein
MNIEIETRIATRDTYDVHGDLSLKEYARPQVCIRGIAVLDNPAAIRIRGMLFVPAVKGDWETYRLNSEWETGKIKE